MSGKSYKDVEVKPPLQGALDSAREEIEALGSECDDAYNNFPNQDHPKAQMFYEAASTLQGISGLDEDIPEEAQVLVVTYHETVPRRRAYNPSRDSRLSNAVAALTAVSEALTDWAETTEDAEGVEQAREMALSCEEAASSAEGVEFPGMFG